MEYLIILQYSQILTKKNYSDYSTKSDAHPDVGRGCNTCKTKKKREGLGITPPKTFPIRGVRPLFPPRGPSNVA